MDTCSVTQRQPFGQGGPGLEVAPGKRNSIVVHAGRQNDKQNAEAFVSGLKATNLLGIYQHEVSTPNELNFAFRGTLTLTFNGKTLTFPDFRLGQGQKSYWYGTYNNWWIGAEACKNTDGDVLQCTSQEGVRINFGGRNSDDNIFDVGIA